MARRFLALWLPAMLLLVGVAWVLYGFQVRNARARVQLADQGAIQLATRIGAAEFSNVRADLLYLADQYRLQFDGGMSMAARAALAAQYQAFALRKRLYDQVRFLDTGGQEIIRVNWNGGHPAIVPPERLQNKADRPYLRTARAMGRDEVYVSPLELNVEDGTIERPLKPVIRFATPVVDAQGHTRGVMVLNYLGDRLLDRLRALAQDRPGQPQIWLMNADGYWMLGPRGEDEWGFMLPGGSEKRLALRDPTAWKAIAARAQGQVATAQGLYTYARIAPLPPTAAPRAAMTAPWIVVAYQPAAALSPRGIEPLSRRVWTVFAVLALTLSATAWAIAFYSTQRRLTEETLRASEARFRTLLDTAPDAIITVDREGRIVHINALAEKYFGYERAEMVAQSVDMLIPDRVRERHRHHRETFAANPYTRQMGEGMELFGRRKDGSEFPLEISLSPLETPQGMVVTAIIRDISARKHMEQLREEAQARYRDLINNLPVGVYRKAAGPQGHFLEVNPALVAMLEAESAEELLQQPFETFHPSASGPEPFTERLGDEDVVVNEEVAMLTLKGRPFYGAISARIKRKADGEIYFDGIIEDITHRKDIERQLQSRSIELEAINQELEAFSYSVSHDLRAPLRAIDGFSRILLTDYADRLDDTGRDRLDRVRRAAQRMGTLIDDLLKLSRVTRTELKREQVDLSGLAGEVMEDLRRQAPDREVQVHIAPGLTAEGDRGLLRIVLDNLLGNAWKFTSSTPAAHIGLATTSETGRSVYIVSDNGAGFDMAYANKLFGVFQRLHDASEFPGTGIGLATVQRIVHKHGGRIWAESEVGKGTRFYFTLEPEIPS